MIRELSYKRMTSEKIIYHISEKKHNGKGILAEYIIKETLCFIGPSTGLESGVKYAEVPSTSSLRCCLTATITSRRDGGALRYMLPMKATFVDGDP